MLIPLDTLRKHTGDLSTYPVLIWDHWQHMGYYANPLDDGANVGVSSVETLLDVAHADTGLIMCHGLHISGDYEISEILDNLEHQYKRKQITCHILKMLLRTDVWLRCDMSRNPGLARASVDAWALELLGAHAPK